MEGLNMKSMRGDSMYRMGARELKLVKVRNIQWLDWGRQTNTGKSIIDEFAYTLIFLVLKS